MMSYEEENKKAEKINKQGLWKNLFGLKSTQRTVGMKSNNKFFNFVRHRLTYGLIFIFIFNIVNYFLDHNKYFSVKETAKLKQPRIEANSSLMCSDKVLITGRYKNFPFESRLKTTEIYDLKTNKVIKRPDMNFAHT